jgi:serine/threonine-protein kinase ATR
MLLKTLCAFPQQGVWHIAVLIGSSQKDRKDLVKRVLKETHRRIKDLRPNDGRMLAESQQLFQSFISLATLQTSQRRIPWQPDRKVQWELFLVPTQHVLMHCDPTLTLSTVNNQHGSISSSGFMRIQRLHDTVDVAASKARPKTFRLDTDTGRTLKFLCKQEKDGDLRKGMISFYMIIFETLQPTKSFHLDVRLMEFNAAVNKIFSRDSLARLRRLRLRTYAVVCLNDECGVLEWVEHTEAFRSLINQSHNFWPEVYPPVNLREAHVPIKEVQEKHDDDLDTMMRVYKETIGWYRPCFHKWFLETFRDASAWHEARTVYTRSAAVWSAVGHVIGLGDRHTENILLDVTNGECVHVDFDCIFDKGLTLARPEIIPFRLTQNMVDAMGICGVEGGFRRTLELTLQLLREHRELLLSVLEPFLRDPTVAWSRTGRAQREEVQRHGSSINNANTNGSSILQDRLNSEATDMLKRISARLSGIYHFLHPHRERLIRGAKARGQVVPTRGVGPSREELLPLSVQGQAQKLIEEATALENLSQLYYGWQAWL